MSISPRPPRSAGWVRASYEITRARRWPLSMIEEHSNEWKEESWEGVKVASPRT